MSIKPLHTARLKATSEVAGPMSALEKLEMQLEGNLLETKKLQLRINSLRAKDDYQSLMSAKDLSRTRARLLNEARDLSKRIDAEYDRLGKKHEFD